MISALQWISKGKAQEYPTKTQLSEEEFERISQHLKLQLEDNEIQTFQGDQQGQDDNEESTDLTQEMNNDDMNDDDEMAKYNLDTYDEEPDANSMSLFSNVQSLSYFPPNTQDPYLESDDEDNEEREELRIAPTDNLIVTAKTEDDISHLEVYVYEEDEDNLYIHHDILLPSFPLCLEWLDFPCGQKAGQTNAGNYIAVGTFEPHVEIWDLDRIDSMFPDVILGSIPTTAGDASAKKKKGGPLRVAKKANPERHVDAVMSLSWNKTQRNLMASGSADQTVKLWDIQKPGVAVTSYSHHKNKVQAVLWNPIQPTVLLTGGYDKFANVFDSRAPEAQAQFKLSADVECLVWDTYVKEQFYVSTEDGRVTCFDTRNYNANSKTQKSVFTLDAHDSAVSALALHPTIPGCMLTGSADKKVKLWKIENVKPTCLVSRDVDAGKIFSAQFCPDAPLVAGIGGSKGKVVVWNLETLGKIKSAFSLNGTKKPKEMSPKELVIMESDEENESDEDEIKDEEMHESDWEDDEI